MILYRWNSRQAVLNPDGTARTYRSGQPMEWPATVAVTSFYDKGPQGTQDDVVLVSATQSTTGSGHAGLLATEAVRALRDALLGQDGWTSVPEAQGTFMQLSWVESVAVFSVVGYGHEWKRTSVRMPVDEVGRFADTLANWVENGWAGCRKVIDPPPVKPAKAVPCTPCRPTGDLADPGQPLDGCRNGHRWTCRWCSVPMRVEWQAGDWQELSDDGAMFGSVKPPVGENGYEFWTWLREQSAAGHGWAAGDYSMLAVILGMTGDPFTHRHLVGSKRCQVPGCVEDRTEPPWCCAQPMWLTGEGWRCRVGRQMFPFKPVSVAS